MSGPTREEVLREIGRELAKRREVFPRWVEAGRLTQQQADDRIACMQAGYDWLRENWPSTQRALI